MYLVPGRCVMLDNGENSRIFAFVNARREDEERKITVLLPHLDKREGRRGSVSNPSKRKCRAGHLLRGKNRRHR